MYAKVLIVDDEPAILLALNHLMLKEGHEVITAKNGNEAIEYLQSYIPDIVILDVMMPGIDGFEVAQYIRSQDQLKDLSIIFLTARGQGEDRMKGYDVGAERYLVKPFDNKELLDIVKDTLALNK